MRTLIVLICSVALACAAVGAQKEDKSKSKKKQVQSTQHAAAPGGRQGGAGPQKKTGQANTNKPRHGSTQKSTYAGWGANHSAAAQKMKGKTKGSQQISARGGQAAQKTKAPQRVGGQIYQSGSKTKGKGSQQVAAQQSANYDVQKTKKSKVSGTSVAGFQSSTKSYKAKHFNLSVNTRPTTITGVTFQQNRRIGGSQYWQGRNYTVFRTYTPVWHERNWWNNHYNRVVFVYGGWYYWNAGWWYPAWGYAPNAYYAYDGPIYAYNDLPPDQVTANVQSALQQQGYYQGDVDGLLGPLTRSAIADYQRDHGLYVTAAIDRPTLQSLGMT
jgi:Putative peptidoglycan binding domain